MLTDEAPKRLACRGQVHAQARELEVLAKRAIEFSTPGPKADLTLALRQFEHMRAILGTGEGG